MKRNYIKPEVFLVGLGNLMDDVIHQGSNFSGGGFGDAKENDISFDDWGWDSEEGDDSDPYESLWDD